MSAPSLNINHGRSLSRASERAKLINSLLWERHERLGGSPPWRHYRRLAEEMLHLFSSLLFSSLLFSSLLFSSLLFSSLLFSSLLSSPLLSSPLLSSPLLSSPLLSSPLLSSPRIVSYCIIIQYLYLKSLFDSRKICFKILNKIYWQRVSSFFLFLSFSHLVSFIFI